jgi:hypothetical protein
MLKSVSFFMSLFFVVAGCGGASLKCASNACPSGGKSYQTCTSGGTQTFKFNGQSCGCDTASPLTCTTSCAAEVAAYCGDSVVPDGGSPDGSTPDGSTGPVMMVTGTNHSQFATNTLTLPTNGTQFAIDLNGDGIVDNQLGKIIGAFSSIGLTPQAATSAAVAQGSSTLLIDEQSSDPTQQSAADAGAKLVLANTPATPPKYDGTDTFTASSSDTPSQFLGNISSGELESNSPVTATTPVQITLALALAAGQAPLLLPVTAGYIQFTNTSGKLSGQIDGAIKQTDVETTIIPAFAQVLNTEYNDPSTPAATKEELASFDTNNDGTITAAELMANPIVSAVVAPDVQLFTNGIYAPNKANTVKDSLSLGISFTAVKASF